MLSELVEAGCIKRWRRSDEGVTSVFLKFQAGLPLPATRTLGLQGRPRLSQLLQRRASTATRYMTFNTKAPSASSSAFISQWCSSGWRCRTLGLTGSLVDGAAPRTTAPVGTFRELLRRGIQVGNKMGVGVCWKIFIFVRFLECIKSADQTWGIWHHLVDRNMFFPQILCDWANQMIDEKTDLIVQVWSVERCPWALPHWPGGLHLQKPPGTSSSLLRNSGELQKLRPVVQQLRAESVHQRSRAEWSSSHLSHRWVGVWRSPLSASRFFTHSSSSSEHVAAPPVVSAPLKFAIPHAVVRFGPAGQLIRVSPAMSTQENIGQLEIHSLEVSRADLAQKLK